MIKYSELALHYRCSSYDILKKIATSGNPNINSDTFDRLLSFYVRDVYDSDYLGIDSSISSVTLLIDLTKNTNINLTNDFFVDLIKTTSKLHSEQLLETSQFEVFLGIASNSNPNIEVSTLKSLADKVKNKNEARQIELTVKKKYPRTPASFTRRM